MSYLLLLLPFLSLSVISRREGSWQRWVLPVLAAGNLWLSWLCLAGGDSPTATPVGRIFRLLAALVFFAASIQLETAGGKRAT
ncbi:MAG: hypothetical protein LBU79_00465, partial [Planctomycetota bacterium]|nr:hypothetical protein [Planctomycetota bacterium]